MIKPQDIDALAGTLNYDSTAAINAAIMACPRGGKLALESTEFGYLVSDELLATEEITIEGEGGTFFHGTMAPGKDLIRIAPAAGRTLRGLQIHGLNSFVTGSGNVIRFDTRMLNSGIAEVHVADNFLVGMSGKDVIKVDNAPGNYNGGTFNAEFGRNTLSVNSPSGACINISYGGDSIKVLGGILTGNGYAVLSSQIAYAGGLLIGGGVNITATSGIAVVRGIKPIIRDFIMEFNGQIYTGCGISISGSIGLVDGATIGPGQMTAMSATTNFGGFIYLGQCADVEVLGMKMTSAIPGGIGYGVYASPYAANARIGAGNSYVGLNNPIIPNASTKMVQAI